tara:strand:+ start:2328 stop:3617 length:1290 start_codon:yes stop_codon:yes gene_type:complete
LRPKEKFFLESLNNRPILVWGARMTGMGLLRFSKKHNLNIVGFVDRDPSLIGRTIDNFKINKPNVIPSLKAKHKDLLVIIAVALKEDEIINSLEEMGVSKKDCVNYSEYCDQFFTIDVVGTCNLNCPSCAQSIAEIKNPVGTMKLNDFKQVVKKMKEEVDMVTHVSLYSWGEPLLHTELNLLIDHLHEEGIAAAVSSHLSIPSSNQIQKLVKSAPEYLKISISGFYPEAYNSTHTGGDINLVKSNMYKIKYYMERYKSKIYVDVNYHVYKNNIGKDLEMMQKLCDELGFGLSTTYPVVMPIERCIDYLEGKPSKATLELSKLLLVNIDEGLEITKAHRDQPCRYLTNQLNINWDRSVPLCCVSFDRQKNNSIISNDYLKESLKDLSKKKEKHSLCTKCMGLGIPPYQLGVNEKGWEAKAKQNSDPGKKS